MCSYSLTNSPILNYDSPCYGNLSMCSCHSSDRKELLFLLKNLKECKWDSTSFQSAVYTIIDRLEPTIAGLLTESEFETLLCSLFTISPHCSDAITILISSLSSTSSKNSFKFFKIIDVIDFIQEKTLLDVLTSGTGDGNTTCPQLDYFSRILCSFSDRVYNFTGISTGKNFDAQSKIIFRFENKFIKCLVQLIRQNPDALNIQLYLQILVDYSFISSQFIRDFVMEVLCCENSSKMFPKLLNQRHIDPRRHEKFVLDIISVCSDHSSLKVLFGDLFASEDFFKCILVKKILLQPNKSIDKNWNQRLSLKFSKYFECHSLQLEEIFVQLLIAFTDQCRFIEFTSLNFQFQLAISIVDLGRTICPQRRKLMTDQIIGMMLPIVPEFLRIADISRRQLGMILAETLANLFECSSKSSENLHFEYIEDDNLLVEFRNIINIDSSIINDDQKLTDEKSKHTNESLDRKKFNDSRVAMLDSDDEEEQNQEIVPKFDDSCGRNNTAKTRDDEKFYKEIVEFGSVAMNKPLYLRDCLDILYANDLDYNKMIVVLDSIRCLILKNATGFDDLAEELMEKLIFLDNRFNLPNFMITKTEIVSLVLSRRPEFVSKVVNTMLSQRCSMFLRYFIIDAIVDAAKRLSSIKNIILTKDKSIDDKKSFGKGLKIIRCPTNQQKSVNLTTNKFSKVAVQFILPLLSFQYFRGPHIDFQDNDHMLLGKIILAIGQMISMAANSPSLTRILSETFFAVRCVRNNTHSFITSTCALCYSAMLESFPAEIQKYSFFFEVRDCLEWLDEIIMKRANFLNEDDDSALKNTLSILYVKISQIMNTND